MQTDVPIIITLPFWEAWMCALGFGREQRRDSILSDPTPCSFNGRHQRGSGRLCLFSEPKVGTSASLSSLPGSSQVILILLLSHPRAPNTLNTLAFSCSEFNLPSLSISCAWSGSWSGDATPGFLELLHPKGSHGFRHLTSPQECWGWTYGMGCSRLSQAGVLFRDTLEMSRVNSRKEVTASHRKDSIKRFSTLGVFRGQTMGMFPELSKTLTLGIL